MKIDKMLGELELPTHPTLGMRPLPKLDAARENWAIIRGWNGLSMDGTVKLLQLNGNAKLAKNPIPTYALTLSPAVTAGHNTCERSTPECRKACVMWTAGRGIFPNVRLARFARTQLLADHPYSFLALLHHELEVISAKQDVAAVRLNVASDIRWERFPFLFDFDNLQFYDYTKWFHAERQALPRNYHLTYSHNERWDSSWVNGDLLKIYLECGLNVAMVFDCKKHELPATWKNYTVIDGDLDDYRYGDPRGVIVGLAAKGAAKKLKGGGFVTAVNPT